MVTFSLVSGYTRVFIAIKVQCHEIFSTSAGPKRGTLGRLRNFRGDIRIRNGLPCVVSTMESKVGDVRKTI